jgi:hypothetical protein
MVAKVADRRNGFLRGAPAIPTGLGGNLSTVSAG